MDRYTVMVINEIRRRILLQQKPTKLARKTCSVSFIIHCLGSTLTILISAKYYNFVVCLNAEQWTFHFTVYVYCSEAPKSRQMLGANHAFNVRRFDSQKWSPDHSGQRWLGSNILKTFNALLWDCFTQKIWETTPTKVWKIAKHLFGLVLFKSSLNGVLLY